MFIFFSLLFLFNYTVWLSWKLYFFFVPVSIKRKMVSLPWNDELWNGWHRCQLEKEWNPMIEKIHTAHESLYPSNLSDIFFLIFSIKCLFPIKSKCKKWFFSFFCDFFLLHFLRLHLFRFQCWFGSLKANTNTFTIHICLILISNLYKKNLL